jgi:hypothetical protein
VGIAGPARLELAEGAFVSDLHALARPSADGSATHYADAGLTWLASNDLALDVHAGAGLDRPHPNWFAGLGASVRF